MYVRTPEAPILPRYMENGDDSQPQIVTQLATEASAKLPDVVEP